MKSRENRISAYRKPLSYLKWLSDWGNTCWDITLFGIWKNIGMVTCLWIVLHPYTYCTLVRSYILKNWAVLLKFNRISLMKLHCTNVWRYYFGEETILCVWFYAIPSGQIDNILIQVWKATFKAIPWKAMRKLAQWIFISHYRQLWCGTNYSAITMVTNMSSLMGN